MSTKKSKNESKSNKKHGSIFSHEDKARGFATIQDDTYVHITREVKDPKKYNVYLSYKVVDQSTYHTLFNFLRTRDSKETITFYLNNFGGYVHTAVQLVGIIRECKAKTKCIIEHGVYSAGTILALTFKNIEIKPGATVMIHDFSGGAMGSGTKMDASIKSDRAKFQFLLHDTCHPFFSKDEIKRVINDADIYVEYDEALVRLKRHLNKK